MAVNRFPQEWPSFLVKRFKSIDKAYDTIRDLVINLDQFKTRSILTINDHADRLTPTEGSGAPSSTPSDILLFYLDTSAKDMYVSVGTASSADWKKVTP